LSCHKSDTIDREGIVEFIDQDNPTLITKIAVGQNLSQTEITGINASVNIEMTKRPLKRG
jgi:hypothetical protein